MDTAQYLKKFPTQIGEFIIRPGKITDIIHLKRLNTKWCIQDLYHVDISKGFLFGQPFVESDFEEIIKHCELVTAEINGEIAGYYLFDNVTDNKTSLDYENRIAQMIREGRIADRKICRRAQAVVDEMYQGLGLYREMFNMLNHLCKDKYQIVFSVAHKQNPKLAANQKIGWKIISIENDYCNVFYEIA